MRSDNGPEFVAKELRKWLTKVRTGTLYIKPGSPRENGRCESFNGKLRDECLNGEISYSLQGGRIRIQQGPLLKMVIHITEERLRGVQELIRR